MLGFSPIASEPIAGSAAVATVVAGVQPAVSDTPTGGYHFRTQSKREREEERERLGVVPQKVEAAIRKVAKRQSVDLTRTQAQAEAELKRELKRADVAYQAFYARLMEEQRDALIQQEIAQLMRKAQEDDDEESAILLLM